MWASGQELEVEARKAEKDKAENVRRMQLSPQALKARLAKKKAAERAAKKARTS